MAADGIDPRYAAQFQRGYDPARDAPPPVRPVARRETPARIPGGPPERAPLVDEVRHPGPSDGEAADPVPRGVESEAPEPPAVRAPLIEWALLGTAAVLLTLGAVLFWQAATDLSMYRSVYDPAGQAFATVRNALPGPLLAAAVFALAAWLVLRAVRRAR